MSDAESDKQAAAEAAAAFVEDGMKVGLGTGSTVAYLLPALAQRSLQLRCVATSLATEEAARKAGLDVEPFESEGGLDQLDIAIDGADQVDPDGWLVKGGGGAHTRERIVAAAADRFVVITSGEKIVDALVAPVPLELLPFGLPATLRALDPTVLREDADPSPDGGVIADYQGSVDDPEGLAAWLSATAGVIDHGLFAPDLVSDILIARGGEVEHRRVSS